MITFLTPTYNSAGTLKRLLSSLRRQSDRSFEHLVLDGCSTDRTAEILTEFGVKFEIAPPKGIGDAFNKLVATVNTPYFMFLNSDDFLLENDFVSKINNAISNPFSYYIVSTAYCDNSGAVTRYWRAQKPTILTRYFGLLPDHGGTIFSSKWHSVKSYRDDFKVSVDAEIMLDLTRDASPKVIKNATVIKLLGGASTSYRLSVQKIYEDSKSNRHGAFPLWYLTKKVLKSVQFIRKHSMSRLDKERIKELVSS